MRLRQRILHAVQPEGGGPRKRHILEAMVRDSREASRFDEIFRSMLEAGELVKYSDKRHAVYGPPGIRKRKGWFQ